VKLLWFDPAWQDFLYWLDHDVASANKIRALVNDAMRHPFQGLGKPEPLRGEYAGWWSRRITGEHRLIYRVIGSGDTQRIEIVACRYHY
jgi:toxin YoeB